MITIFINFLTTYFLKFYKKLILKKIKNLTGLREGKKSQIGLKIPRKVAELVQEDPKKFCKPRSL